MIEMYRLTKMNICLTRKKAFPICLSDGWLTLQSTIVFVTWQILWIYHAAINKSNYENEIQMSKFEGIISKKMYDIWRV